MLNPRAFATSLIWSTFPSKIGLQSPSANKRTAAPIILGSSPSGNTILTSFPFTLSDNSSNNSTDIPPKICYLNNTLNTFKKTVQC